MFVDKGRLYAYILFMRVKEKDLPKVEPVKLKPLWGIRPGVYLTVLYAFCILLIILVTGILPDVSRGYRRVSFESKAGTAAVYVDGLYQGGTPFTKRIPSGDHTVSFQVNGVEIDSFDFHVSHPVFYAWLFPRHQTVRSENAVNEKAYQALRKAFLNDVASYSAVLTYSDVNHYPPLFENFAKAVKDTSFIEKDVFETACLFITTEEMSLDAQKACEILGISFDTSIRTDSTVFSLRTSSCEKTEGGYLIDNDFSISSLEVSEAQYQLFLDSNPYWSADNRSTLIEEGLVDRYYLSDFTGSESRPVRNISWYAAKAYCEFTGTKLPTESQWMKAAAVSDTSYQKTLLNASAFDGPKGMFGGLWEMTDSLYIPGDRSKLESISEDLIALGIGSDIIVKGGSYISDASSIDRTTAGTAPMSMCSDYMGFRVIW